MPCHATSTTTTACACAQVGGIARLLLTGPALLPNHRDWLAIHLMAQVRACWRFVHSSAACRLQLPTQLERQNAPVHGPHRTPAAQCAHVHPTHALTVPLPLPPLPCTPCVRPLPAALAPSVCVVRAGGGGDGARRGHGAEAQEEQVRARAWACVSVRACVNVHSSVHVYEYVCWPNTAQPTVCPTRAGLPRGARHRPTRA